MKTHVKTKENSQRLQGLQPQELLVLRGGLNRDSGLQLSEPNFEGKADSGGCEEGFHVFFCSFMVDQSVDYKGF